MKKSFVLINTFFWLKSHRLIDVDSFDDLIGIKLAAANLLKKLGDQHADSSEMQHLKFALEYKHKSHDKN